MGAAVNGRPCGGLGGGTTHLRDCTVPHDQYLRIAGSATGLRARPPDTHLCGGPVAERCAAQSLQIMALEKRTIRVRPLPANRR